jgi:lipoate-protein ligase A
VSTSAGLPVFGFVSVHVPALADGIAREDEWMARAAATGRATAHLWSGTQGFVVPRSTTRLPNFEAACAQSAAAGWPVQVRASGGGLVPQGPGVVNLSLVWRTDEAVPSGTDTIYRDLTHDLAAALARLALAAEPRAVEGSFCDGRFNLAVGPRKVAGTAQAWRRVGGVPVVLAHAVLLVDADVEALTARANEFEAAAGSERRYRTDVVTNVARAWCAAHASDTPPPDLRRQVVKAVAEQFARIVPPKIAADG